MNIRKEISNETVILALEGRLDAVSASVFENELNQIGDDVKILVIDLENLEYISSAGLRLMLIAHKMMSDKGEMKVKNVCESVSDVFDITGFTDILNIE